MYTVCTVYCGCVQCTGIVSIHDFLIKKIKKKEDEMFFVILYNFIYTLYCVYAAVYYMPCLCNL